MIKINIVLENEACLSFIAKGHAREDYKQACVASSFLIRTFLSSLSREGLNFKVEELERGSLNFFYLDNVKSSELYYYSKFLIRGLEDLALEYPNDISLVLEG